ncbi:unnamed protein product [Ilex paraguariensis]|uniref:Phytocyanin domain-containing protein n=1 Tax=Ilex paraguariensis TaxID=185542 RepID=A0ABC8UZ83_9AQUA
MVFVYPADKDSVVRVTKEDYTNCNSATPLDKFTDGHSVFKFDQSGPYYFISGVKENCLKNEKLVVVVMADRNNRSSTEVPPSTAPAGEEAPSPPSGSVEINPSPSPFGETPPPPPPPPSVFVYPADKDSVVRVTKEDYTNCNSATPLDKFTDGHSVFKFDQSGPYYFISGVKENCLKNEKLVVVVMADRNNRSSTEVPPSTAPAGEEAPSPPSGSVEINPSPSPFGETPPPPPPPPPSGATSIYMGVIGCVGTFISSLALVL